MCRARSRGGGSRRGGVTRVELPGTVESDPWPAGGERGQQGRGGWAACTARLNWGNRRRRGALQGRRAGRWAGRRASSPRAGPAMHRAGGGCQALHVRRVAARADVCQCLLAFPAHLPALVRFVVPLKALEVEGQRVGQLLDEGALLGVHLHDQSVSQSINQSINQSTKSSASQHPTGTDVASGRARASSMRKQRQMHEHSHANVGPGGRARSCCRMRACAVGSPQL